MIFLVSLPAHQLHSNCGVSRNAKLRRNSDVVARVAHLPHSLPPPLMPRHRVRIRPLALIQLLHVRETSDCACADQPRVVIA